MAIVFHSVQKIEIIVKGEKQEYIEQLLADSGVTGYTLISDIAGMGHGGQYHEAKLLFNEKASLIMFVAVAKPSIIEDLAEGLKYLFEKSSGVMFVSDVKIARLEKFT
jgi:nitrogen regulatory protein PII